MAKNKDDFKDDIFDIVGPVNGVTPLIAARLCNFPTGVLEPIAAHKNWINTKLKAAIASSPNPWVDIYAFASKRGTATHFDNQGLSNQRRIRVHDLIVAADPRTDLIKQDHAFGASRSAGATEDNNGFWRSVEVYAFGGLPHKREPDPNPPPKPKPKPADSPQWLVTGFSTGGLSIVPEFGGGFATGTITFKNTGTGEEPTDNITIAGVSFGLGESENAKLSSVIQLLKRFPAVQKAIEFLLKNASGGPDFLPSDAQGMVFPMPGFTTLTNNADFKGTCLAFFLSTGLGPLSGGVYVMFMGKQESFTAFIAWVVAALSIPGIGPAAMASSIISNSHAIAVFGTRGISLSVSLGNSGNVWAGRIS